MDNGMEITAIMVERIFLKNNNVTITAMIAPSMASRSIEYTESLISID